MRNRLVCIFIAFGALICALVLTGLEQRIPAGKRYHQHMEEPGEDMLQPCTVCDGGSDLCTHLPIISIDAGGQKIPGAAILGSDALITGYETGEHGAEQILAGITTVETPGLWRHAGDTPSVSAKAYIRYRGDTSRAFSKHSYLIKLVEDDNYLQNKNVSMLGMDADNEWALHGPFLDKTLMRNYMWMNISAEIMGDAPDVRFCELLVDGQYQGVYVLMETNTFGAGRIRLTQYSPGDPVCSYIVRIGTNLNPSKMINVFSFYTGRLEGESGFEVIYPTLPYQTEAVHDYIRTDLSEIERLLYSYQMGDASGAWKDEIDVGSFVDYYILQEFLGVNDAFTKSTYFYRDVRGKLHIGPVWDYNNALDNFFRPIPEDEFILSRRGWYGQLLMDKGFVDSVIWRYRELRRGILSDQQLNAYIDQTISWLGSAIVRNEAVWGYAYDTDSALLSPAEIRQPPLDFVKEITEQSGGNTVLADEKMRAAIRAANPASYDEAVTWMRDYMVRRGTWLDAHIDSLRQHCAPSKNAMRILR